MKRSKKKEPRRNSEVLPMILSCHARKFRHKGDRRAKDARRQRETFE